jgi:hypothetical protein
MVRKIDMSIPKRYGKNQILKDIDEQGGKPTPLQEMMLSLNELKNLYANLNKRGMEELFSDSPTLSDIQCEHIKKSIKSIVSDLSTYTIRNSKPKKTKT